MGEIDPQLLHRSLRGREATMSLSQGTVHAPQYGAAGAHDSIDGLELLAKSREERGNKRRKTGSAEAPDAKEMMSKEVLSSDDFKKMRKLQLQKSVETQLGRKRKAVEMSDSSDAETNEKESDSEESVSDGERGLVGRMPDFMSAEQLRGHRKKGR